MKNRYDNFPLRRLMKRQILLGVIGAGMAMIQIPVMAEACSVCLTGAGDPTADAFNWSVLFLMAAPYLVVGSIAGWLVHTYRRAAAKGEENEASRPVVHLAWDQKESGR